MRGGVTNEVGMPSNNAIRAIVGIGGLHLPPVRSRSMVQEINMKLKQKFSFASMMAIILVIGIVWGGMQKAMASDPPSCRQPTLTGELRLGGALADLVFAPSMELPAAPVVEFKLHLKNAVGPIGLRAEVVHPFNDDFFWRYRRQFIAGVDMPIGRDASFFGEFRRLYTCNENWWWGGVSYKFGRK